MTPLSDDTIAGTTLALAEQRGPGKSLCPSEVARALDSHDWRRLMPRVRSVAEALRASGRLLVLQKQQPVPSAHVTGPIRLALPPPST